MRVLVISNLFPPFHRSGYELGCHDIVNSLKNRQHHIKVLTSNHGIKGTQIDGDIHRMMTINFKDTPDWKDVFLKEFMNQTIFKRICLDFKPEVSFFFNLSHVSVSLYSIAEKIGLPTCSYYANNWFVTRENDQWYRLWPEGERGFKILRFLTRRFKLLPPPRPFPSTFSIFANGYLKNLAIELNNASSDAVVIPWGIDSERFSYKSQPNPEPSRLLYVGQIQPDEGIDDIIKTLSLLRRKSGQPTISLTIAGDEKSSPDYTVYLKNLADNLGVMQNLSFIGSVHPKDMPNLYHTHDILISSSHSEQSSGRTLLEAMSSGTAIVSAVTESNSEILENEVNALLFPKYNLDLFAEQIQRLLEDNKLRESIRTNARKTIEGKFRMAQSMDSLEKVLRKTAETTKPGDRTQISQFLPSSLKHHQDVSMEDLVGRIKGWLAWGKLIVFIRILLRPKFFLQVLKKIYQKTTAITPHSIYRIIFNIYFFLKGQRRKTTTSDPHQTQNILVVQLADIGDVILSSPFLRELRRFYPAAWIGLAIQPRMTNLVEKCPYVDEVIAFDWRAAKHWNSYRLGSPRWWIQASRSAKHNFWKRSLDMAISTRWNEDPCQAATLILLYTSGAVQQIAYKETSTDRKPFGWRDLNRLITHGPPRGFPKHEVEQQLDILRYLGGTPQDTHLEVWTSEEDERVARTIIHEYDIEDRDLTIAFAPGATWSFRRWPSKRFIDLGNWLQENYKAYILIFAGKDEQDLALEIEQGLQKEKTINLAGKTTLREMASILKHCKLFVGNDSGPLHIATAAGVPVVGFYGPGEYRRFKPWGMKHEVLRLGLSCSPCSQNCIFFEPRCIKGITVVQAKNCLARHLPSVLDPS